MNKETEKEKMESQSQIQNPQQLSSVYLLPSSSSNKKTLVLDLDETLVHSQFQPFDTPADIILKIELENEIHDIHVMVRPGVKEFLKKMGEIFEVVIFTASVSKYADPLLDIIDKEKNCKFRLFREHCTQINSCYVKEIQKLGRELKNIIIVDNSPMSYALNPENGIPISTWFEDKNDKELYNVSAILEFLSFVPDVRNYINQFIINDEISYTNVINVFDKYNQMLSNDKNNTDVNINNTNNKDKDKEVINNNKKVFNKNNSKTKFKNKENISNNISIYKFKKNLTLNNLKQKEKNEDNKENNNTNNIKINKKVKQISKNNKSKSKIVNIKENLVYSENINPNVNPISNIKNQKKNNFDPSSIITSVSKPINNSNNNNNNKLIKHRKSDSLTGLHLPQKIYEKNSLNLNLNNTNSLHSHSIILNSKKKKFLNNFNNIFNSSTNAHTTKNKSNKNFQLSVRMNHNLHQELKKLEQSIELDEKNQKKLSKSLTKDKITISLSPKNKKIINANNYSTNTYSSQVKTNYSNYIYHKKHKSINTSFIPFPSTAKNITDKNNNIKNHKYSKNSFSGNSNKHRYIKGINLNINNIYSTSNNNNSHTNSNYNINSNLSVNNHSSILGSITLGNSNNNHNAIFNNLTYKNKQRNSQRKIINLMEMNKMKTERNREIKENKENINLNSNINLNDNKKNENKIPFSINKKKKFRN